MKSILVFPLSLSLAIVLAPSLSLAQQPPPRQRVGPVEEASDVERSEDDQEGDEAGRQDAEPEPETASPQPNSPGDNGQLRFAFSGTAWHEVLDWFASEADLALQLDQAPIGTFTFSDPSRSYSVSEALDVLNLTLMKSGYTLVRRGRILQLIDLEREKADKMISEIAELVDPADLDERGKSDIVSSIFPLGSLSPSDAREELAQMIGPAGRIVVLDSARRVKVTESASKLIAIRDMLEQVSTAETDVVEIVLKNRAADEILEIARPLLGLESGENSGEDIRISVGLYGDRIYASGLPGKLGLLQSIVDRADRQTTSDDTTEGTELKLPIFRTHRVRTADTTTAFDVLQTLLAGTPDARLAIDPKTDAIIAWARPETHQLIEATIAEMEGSGQSFKVLDLRRLDPAQ